MARKLKKRSFEDASVWYLPDIDDNREDLDNDPFKVLIEPMSAAEFRQAEDRSLGRVVRRKGNALTQARKLRDQIVASRTPKVTGYVAEDENGKEVEIKTGKALVKAIQAAEDPSEDRVLDDIFEAIKDASVLEAGLEKKLRSLSESSHARTASSASGVALAAVE